LLQLITVTGLLIGTIPHLKHSLKGNLVRGHALSLFDRGGPVHGHLVDDAVEKVGLMVLPFWSEHVIDTPDDARNEDIPRFVKFGLRHGHAHTPREVFSWKQRRPPSFWMWIGFKLRTLFLLNLIDIDYRVLIDYIEHNIDGDGRRMTDIGNFNTQLELRSARRIESDWSDLNYLHVKPWPELALRSLGGTQGSIGRLFGSA
jgi:hypothetical protein